MMRISAAVWLVGLSSFAVGCGKSDGTVSEPENVDTAALEVIDGLTLYSDNGCAGCHCNDAVGDCNLSAPEIRGASREELRSALGPGADHPSEVALTDEELEGVALFLARLAEGEPPDLEQGSLITRGFNLYLAGACLECHLSSSRGTSQGGFGVPLVGISPDQIYGALVGPEQGCHPLRLDPEQSPPECTDLVATNGTLELLTDLEPPELDTERVALASFLNFIAPQLSSGVEPCENRPFEICTIAGTGESRFGGDGGASTEATLYYPIDVSGTNWYDDDGEDLVVVDWNNHRVRAIDLDQAAETVAGDADTAVLNPIRTIGGTGSVSGEGALYHPTDAAFDAEGALITASWHSQNLYRYTRGQSNLLEREQLAGGCDLACNDDRDGPILVREGVLALPSSSAVHPDGRIFLSEAGCSRIRILDPRGVVPAVEASGECLLPVNLYGDATLSTLAGAIDCPDDGSDCAPVNGYAGDGEAASSAVFNVENTPSVANFGIYLSPEDPPACLYVADSKNNVIRRVDLLAEPPAMELFAGNPEQAGFEDGPGLGGALFNFPANVFVAPSGVVYVADARNHAIRSIDPESRMVETVAGTGRGGFNGDNRPAVEADLNLPGGVWLHPDGRLFIADSLNHRVRVVCPEQGCQAAPEAVE